MAHNVGGGLIGPLFLLGLWAFTDDCSVAFYVPAIEEYKDDYSENETKFFEIELSANHFC